MKRIFLLIFILALTLIPFQNTLFGTVSFANAACVDTPNSAGLVPCGKSINDPGTNWNECDACGPCSLILMMQLVIEFLVRISGIFATLAIILGGFVYVLAGGVSSIISKAKSMIKYSLVGFITILIAWVVIDSILTTMGYIDPMDGVWYAIC
jgi:hypothetical protein